MKPNKWKIIRQFQRSGPLNWLIYFISGSDDSDYSTEHPVSVPPVTTEGPDQEIVDFALSQMSGIEKDNDCYTIVVENSKWVPGNIYTFDIVLMPTIEPPNRGLAIKKRCEEPGAIPQAPYCHVEVRQALVFTEPPTRKVLWDKTTCTENSPEEDQEQDYSEQG